jgi:hypothetical protein
VSFTIGLLLVGLVASFVALVLLIGLVLLLVITIILTLKEIISNKVTMLTIIVTCSLGCGFELLVSFCELLLFNVFLEFFMKRVISSSSHLELSSFSLELSTTSYLFLLFLFALQVISCFLVVVMFLKRFLT